MKDCSATSSHNASEWTQQIKGQGPKREGPHLHLPRFMSPKDKEKKQINSYPLSKESDHSTANGRRKIQDWKQRSQGRWQSHYPAAKKIKIWEGFDAEISLSLNLSHPSFGIERERREFVGNFGGCLGLVNSATSTRKFHDLSSVVGGRMCSVRGGREIYFRRKIQI